MQHLAAACVEQIGLHLLLSRLLEAPQAVGSFGITQCLIETVCERFVFFAVRSNRDEDVRTSERKGPVQDSSQKDDLNMGRKGCCSRRALSVFLVLWKDPTPRIWRRLSNIQVFRT